MSLTNGELAYCKASLGYNVLTIDSEPRIDHLAIWEQVIQDNVSAGASTTSATAVTAATTPTPVALTLASATGFAAGDLVVIDVDTRQETATIQSISGAIITVQLTGVHSGTYPVVVDEGETLVRATLSKLRDVDDKMTSAASTAGLKSVGRGAVEWHGNAETSLIRSLQSIQMHHRDELASLLGVPNMWRLKQSAMQTSSLY